MRGKRGFQGSSTPSQYTRSKVRRNVFATWSGETRSPGEGEEAKRNSFAGRKKRGRKRVSCETGEREGTSRARPKWREGLRAARNERRATTASKSVAARALAQISRSVHAARENAALPPTVALSAVYTLARAPLTCVALGIRILEYRERLFLQTATVRECLREQGIARKCVVSFSIWWDFSGALTVRGPPASIEKKIVPFRFSDNSHVRIQESKVCIIVSLMHRDDGGLRRLSTRILYRRSIVLQVKPDSRSSAPAFACEIQNCEIGEREPIIAYTAFRWREKSWWIWVVKIN